jgi:GDP/UDP-N,N'-diacetylbacillosamine 2-epimerase (hydrolysing)
MSSRQRKILAFTGCRSDYDLLSALFKKLHADPEFDFSLLVSGTHLSPNHGETVKLIEADGLPISVRVASIPSQPMHELRLESAANLFCGASSAVAEHKPDLLLFAGDREDVIIAALIGVYLGIPTAHFFGGDHALDGHVDHLVRHATSKLASFHFVSTSEHRKRLLALGETESRIFQIGSPALDKFVQEPNRPLKEVFRSIGKSAPLNYAILIYHPMPEEGLSTGQCFENILQVLVKKGIFTYVSHPNIDTGNEDILRVIERYRGHPSFHFYHNLARIDFISLLRHASFLIGNSSCGILEAAFLKLAVVNVGNRQRGRAASENVLFVDGDMKSIQNGVEHLLSSEFQAKLKKITSIYGEGDSVDKAHKILKQLDYAAFLKKIDDPLPSKQRI